MALSWGWSLVSVTFDAYFDCVPVPLLTLTLALSFPAKNNMERSSVGEIPSVSEILNLPRQTIEHRPMSASGKSRVSSAKVLRPQVYHAEKRERNKSASLTRRRESTVRRVSSDAGQQQRQRFYIGGGKTVDDIERPPSRQSNAFPMSLAGPGGGGEGEEGAGIQKHSDGGDHASNNLSPSAAHAGPSSSVSTVKSAIPSSGSLPKKHNRPSSRKKPPAKNMFLNDETKLDSNRQVITEVSSPPRKAGWAVASEGVGEDGEAEEEIQETTEQPSTSKGGLIRSSGSPSNLSLGDLDDDVEFILSPTPPTRVREIDERRDNPERDGFAEIEESGLYEIKIEVQNSSSERGEERRIVESMGLGVAATGAGGVEDEIRGGNNGDKDVIGVVGVEDGNVGNPVPRKINGARQVRTIRTAPQSSIFLGGSNLGTIPTPPASARPETVASSSNCIDEDVLEDSDSDEGYGDGQFDLAFTPVSKEIQQEGWTEQSRQNADDIMLTSFNGDDGLDDLMTFDLETNLGDDFLNLFAPSPPPAGSLLGGAKPPKFV